MVAGTSAICKAACWDGSLLGKESYRQMHVLSMTSASTETAVPRRPPSGVASAGRQGWRLLRFAESASLQTPAAGERRPGAAAAVDGGSPEQDARRSAEESLIGWSVSIKQSATQLHSPEE